jgi:micrococcal nuclease
MRHALHIQWILAFWLLCLGLLTVSTRSHAATLTAAQARDHIGENATICGAVASATFAAHTQGTPTFLNLDQPYPTHIFTVMIWGNDRPKFSKPEVIYKGKRLCITGIIKNFRGRPEVVVQILASVTNATSRSDMTRQ